MSQVEKHSTVDEYDEKIIESIDKHNSIIKEIQDAADETISRHFHKDGVDDTLSAPDWLCNIAWGDCESIPQTLSYGKPIRSYIDEHKVSEWICNRIKNIAIAINNGSPVHRCSRVIETSPDHRCIYLTHKNGDLCERCKNSKIAAIEKSFSSSVLDKIIHMLKSNSEPEG